MSQVADGDNRDAPEGPSTAAARPGRPPGAKARHALVGLVALAWTITMAQVLRSEVLQRRDSPDMRALVDSARLTRTHASARWSIRTGDRILGTIRSSVSGSRDEEQLAYVVEGELLAPIPVRLKGVVVATWDRKPERLVLDVEIASARHRVDGSLQPDGALRLRHLPPGAAPADAREWELPEPPLLGPGPLPIPSLARAGADVPGSGWIEDPSGGGDVAWEAGDARPVVVSAAGRRRSAWTRELTVRGTTLRLTIEDSGLPLRLDLPGGVVVELVEDVK